MFFLITDLQFEHFCLTSVKNMTQQTFIDFTANAFQLSGESHLTELK